MKAIRRYISRNWIWIVVGLILTEVAVRAAYAERGYIAYGGEWLVLPVVLMLVQTARNAREAIRDYWETEEDYEPGRNRANRSRRPKEVRYKR